MNISIRTAAAAALAALLAMGPVACSSSKAPAASQTTMPTTAASGATANPSTSPANTATAARVTTTPAATSADCPKQVTIHSPVQEQRVDHQSGVQVKLDVCLFPDQALFAYDNTDGTFMLDGNGPDNTGPIATASGSVTWLDAPIGDDGANHEPNTITLVVCSNTVGTPPNEVVEFPAGCTPVGQVTVLVWDESSNR